MDLLFLFFVEAGQGSAQADLPDPGPDHRRERARRCDSMSGFAQKK
jgi:hypothetical protein